MVKIETLGTWRRLGPVDHANPEMLGAYDGKLHGDHVNADRVREVDVEFTDMRGALAWSEELRGHHGVTFRDPRRDLFGPVVLTVYVGRPDYLPPETAVGKPGLTA